MTKLISKTTAIEMAHCCVVMDKETLVVTGPESITNPTGPRKTLRCDDTKGLNRTNVWWVASIALHYLGEPQYIGNVAQAVRTRTKGRGRGVMEAIKFAQILGPYQNPANNLP
jgi:hypothetical protein